MLDFVCGKCNDNICKRSDNFKCQRVDVNDGTDKQSEINYGKKGNGDIHQHAVKD